MQQGVCLENGSSNSVGLAQEIIYRAAMDPAATRETWEARFQIHTQRTTGPAKEREAEAKKVDVPIPWRPPWKEARTFRF